MGDKEKRIWVVVFPVVRGQRLCDEPRGVNCIAALAGRAAKEAGATGDVAVPKQKRSSQLLSISAGRYKQSASDQLRCEAR
jgi:hypothetical protein